MRKSDIQMGKALSFVFIIILLTSTMIACVQKTDTWQEQYDLGVRYLRDGNYEEAIIAFTAAIEIDPKRAEAYVGRGDAHIGSGETEESLAAALMDYEKAIEIDETNAMAYLGAADVYIRQGDYAKALEILKLGLERTTNNQHILDKFSELNNQMDCSISEEEEDFLSRCFSYMSTGQYDEMDAFIWECETSNVNANVLIAIEDRCAGLCFTADKKSLDYTGIALKKMPYTNYWYFGELKDGEPYGYGVCLDVGGGYASDNLKHYALYEGQWEKGRPNGEGRVTYYIADTGNQQNCHITEGTYKDGLENGNMTRCDIWGGSEDERQVVEYVSVNGKEVGQDSDFVSGFLYD